MAKLIPTIEQMEAQDAYRTGESLAIEALAGTGKTTLLRMLVDIGSPRGGSILYTSFGKKSVADAKAKFPGACKVSTNHSLAWGVGARYKDEGRLQQRIQPSMLAALMGWQEQLFAPHARLMAGTFGVIETLNAFCQSDDAEPNSAHAAKVALKLCKSDAANASRLAPVLVGLAHRVWDDAMQPGSRLPITHDMYLKRWALSVPRLRYSTILYDEAQDASPVMIGVLRRQEHAQLVVVGDRRQAIYGFRGSVNAMDMFKTVHRTALTRSFRFGPEIAEVANAVLLDQCVTDVLLEGDPAQPGIVGPCSAPSCVLSRTNSTLIGELFSAFEQRPGARMAIVGGVNDLIDLVDGARLLQSGSQSAHADLAEFNDWADVVVASEDDGYAHLRQLVSLVQTYGVPELKDRLFKIRGNESDLEACDTAFSTAHKAKGAEFRSVVLADDFKPKGPPGNPEAFGWSPEEGNLLYVACTRARRHLDAMGCEAVASSVIAQGVQLTPAAPDVEPHDPASVPDDPFAFLDEELGRQDRSLANDPAPLFVPEPFALLAGEWPHPLINDSVVTVAHVGDETEVLVRASGYILFRSIGKVQELGATTKRVTVRVGSASFDVPPEAVA